MDLLGSLSNLKVDTVLSAVDRYVPGAQTKIKSVVDKAKAYINNSSDLELKVLDATNHDPWGPHGSDMQEITNNSFNSEGFHQIMGVIDQRLSESPENWRLVYKALLLLEYMVKHGPLTVAEATTSWSRLSHLEKLRDRFEFKEPSGRDQGVNVRQRAGAIIALVQDRARLTEEREKAAKNKTKYTGVSSSAMRYGGFAPGAAAAVSSSSSSYGAGGGGGSSAYETYGCGGGAAMLSRAWGGFDAAAAAPGAGTGAAAADPVEATRQRIARLKAEGGGDAAAAAPGSVGAGLESPTGEGGLSPRKPKKLSQVKVNPAISAAFASGGLAPPPSSKRSAGGGGGADLLGDLLGPTELPAAAAPAAAPAAPAAAGGKGGVDDDWDSFASAAPAPAAATSSGHFSPVFAAQPAAAAAAAQPAAPADPFAASAALPAAPQPAKAAAAGAPKLGPETAKAKDPFADLAFI